MLVVTSLVLFKLILVPVQVTGLSMEPTCYDGEISAVNVLAYVWHHPRRGDIVGFHSVNGSQIIIKRIIGLPGGSGSV